MTKLRDDLLKKYGVAAGTAGAQVETPEINVTSTSTDRREALLNKYSTPVAKTPVQPAVVKTQEDTYNEPGILGQFKEGAIEGYYQARASFGGALQAIGTKTGIESIEDFGENITNKWVKKIQDNPEIYAPEDLGRWKDPRFYARSLGALVPSLGGALAAGVAGAGIGTAVAGPAGGVVGGIGAAGAYSVASEGGSAYNEAIENGASEEDAARIAGYVGVINGALEATPIGRLLTKNPAGQALKKSILKRVGSEIVKQGLTEAPTEVLQEMVNNSLQKEFDENRSLFDGVVESGVFGFLGGGIVGGGLSVVQQNQNKKTTPVKETVTVVEEKIVEKEKEVIVEKLVSRPVDNTVIEELQELPPEQHLAFERKVVENLNKNLGTEIKDEKGEVIPGGTVIKNVKSVDGRPAQINQQQQVEIFVPDLMRDLSDIAQGKQVISGEGFNTVVFEMKPGESFDQMSSRYIQEVILHERGHQLTLNLVDDTKLKKLSLAVSQAQKSGNQQAILTAKTNIEQHIEILEQKANDYVKKNREALITEMFPEIKEIENIIQKTPTRIEKKIQKIPKDKKVTIKKTEKQLLKEKLRTQEVAAKKGFKAGKKESKTKFDELTAKIKDRKLSLEQKRSSLVEYASTFLPIRERGKRLKGIAKLNNNSPKAFQEQLDLIFKEADTAERRTAISAIQKELKSTKIKKKNGFPDQKFEAQSQRDLNRIRANVKNDYNKAQIKIADLVSNFAESNPDTPFPDTLVKEIQFLKMEGLGDMTAKELRSVLADIRSIKETGRTKLEIERFNRNADVELNKGKIEENITGGQELPSDLESLRGSKPESRSLFNSAKDFLTTKQFGLEDLLDSLSYFDKTSNQYESFLSKFVHGRTVKAFNLQNEGEQNQVSKVNEAVKDIYKVKKNREIQKTLAELNVPVDLGKIKHADGKVRNLTISRDQAIKKWMELKDETLASTFEEGLNWNQEVINKMESVLTPQDKQFGEWQLDFYRKYYKEVNKVFVKEFGVDLPFNENYSPISRDIDTVVPEHVLMAQEASNYTSVKNGSLTARVNSKIELKPVGSVEVLLRHLGKMEHYKAWTDSMYQFRVIFGDKKIRQSIIDFHGKNYLKVLDNFMNDFARDGVSRSKIITIIDKIRGNVTAALLGLNIPVAIKQQIGLLNYGIEISLKDFTVGVGDFWRAPIQKGKFMYKNSPTIRDRFSGGFERDMKASIEQGRAGKKLGNKDLEFREFLFLLIRNSDKLTVAQGWWATYRSKYNELVNSKSGSLSIDQIKAESIAYADNVTNRVQDTSGIETLSEIQRGGSLAKLFTMFQSQPNKYYRIILNSMRNIRAGRGDKSTHIKRIIWAWLIVPGLYNQLAEQFKPEEYRDDASELAFKTALGPLGFPLITGQMMMSALGWITGEPFNYQASAVFAIMDDIKKGIEKFNNEDAVEATTYMLDAAGKSRGVPTTLATKKIRKALKENKKDDRNIMSVEF